MVRKEIYLKRTGEFNAKADALQKLESRLSVARLLAFTGGIALFFILFGFSSLAAVSVLLVCLIVFGWLVRYHSRIEQRRKHYRNLLLINSRELECIGGKFDMYPDGSEYVDRDHENSYDLDLFGHSSLFQFINRTTSKPASDLLANWLKEPALQNEIPERQQAVRELSDQIDWRQNLISTGYSNAESAASPETIINWTKSPDHFKDPKTQMTIVFLLSGLAILSTALVALLQLPLSLLILIYVINFLYYFSQSRKIEKVHNQVGKSSAMLQSYSSTILLISNNNFSTPLLKSLHDIFNGRTNVSKEIAFLSRMVSRLDARLNIMVAIPLNLFSFWDIRYCLKLENWKRKYGHEIEEWFDAMAQFEALSSLANMAYNNPHWATPGIVPGYFRLEARNAGHPLIPSDRRILNDISVAGAGQTIIVTGSNMSGKSTFLRTIGVNAVLALAGAPVCAETFCISYVRIFSSMRISDSLEDNTSSFYAELKKLANIIKTAEHNQDLLLLLDEILRGTNSNDRYTGSVALLKQLINYNTVTVIATHDLRLASLSEEVPDKIRNFHFDVKIDGEELYFDYKLTPGICRSLNASILMKKMGIKL